MSDTYIVVGSGIVGLYTTFSLIEKGVSPKSITVKAKHLPGDETIEYTSPFAGGNFSCISPDDDGTLKIDKFTYTNVHRVQRALGGAAKCGLDQKPSTEYWEELPSEKKINSLKSYLKDFRILEADQLPKGVVFGISYTTWNFNCPHFLVTFQKYLQSMGVTFIREEVFHIDDVLKNATTKVVFNCTGLGSYSLSGVNDTQMYPTRGQVLVVNAPHVQENRLCWGKTPTDGSDEVATYIIPRPYSGGNIILGGFVQKGKWTAKTFEEETLDILKRTTKLMPELKSKPFKIVKIAAGLRPSRKGGVRIEKTVTKNGKLLIHNYGASGYGYQAGFGMANEATELLLRLGPKL